MVPAAPITDVSDPMPHPASHASLNGIGAMLTASHSQGPHAPMAAAQLEGRSCSRCGASPCRCAGDLPSSAPAHLDHFALARALGVQPEAVIQALEHARSSGPPPPPAANARAMPAPAPLPVAHPPPFRVTGLETARTSDATAYTGSEGLPDGAAAASATPTAAGGASGEGSASLARKAAAVPSALDADAEVAGGQHGGGREEGCERVDMLGRRRVYYTAEEVARHNHPGDCWLIAHGKVYNVTSFLPRHPAGEFAILRHGGLDSTLDYDFHSSKAQRMWAPYHIGFVETAASARAADCAIS